MIKELSFLDRILEFFAKNSKGKTSKVLIATGVITWTMSGLAQIGAIYFNKKIPKREKTYLVYQELAEDSVNIGLFYTFCKFADARVSRYLERGNIIEKKVKETLRVFNINEFKSIEKALQEALAQVDKKGAGLIKSALKSHARAKEVTGILSGFGASLIACNIITPYCRNKIATHFYNSKNEKTSYGHITLKTYQFDNRTKI